MRWKNQRREFPLLILLDSRSFTVDTCVRKRESLLLSAFLRIVLPARDFLGNVFAAPKPVEGAEKHFHHPFYWCLADKWKGTERRRNIPSITFPHVLAKPTNSRLHTFLASNGNTNKHLFNVTRTAEEKRELRKIFARKGNNGKKWNFPVDSGKQKCSAFFRWKTNFSRAHPKTDAIWKC